ncbi:FUSC family protein, partial [Streptomyces anthocyanicus]
MPGAALATFRTPDTGSILTGRPYRAASRLNTLLQDVLETAGGSTPKGTDRAPAVGVAPAAPSPRPGSRSRPTLLALVPTALGAMRKELRRGSPITRHATRVSAVAAAGYVLGTALPLGHGYWAPLTSVMVMRPDFSQTYSRAVARLGGTVVGVAVATAVVRLADPGTYLSGALAV